MYLLELASFRTAHYVHVTFVTAMCPWQEGCKEK